MEASHQEGNASRDVCIRNFGYSLSGTQDVEAHSLPHDIRHQNGLHKEGEVRCRWPHDRHTSQPDIFKRRSS